MKIKMLHGYFIFEEEKAGEISRFNSIYDFSITPVDEYYTFPFIADALDYSFEGLKYLNLIGIVSYSGKPWEVFRENRWVFNFNTNLLMPIDAVKITASYYESRFFYGANGLLMPGSLNSKMERLTCYTAWLDMETPRFKYSEVIFEK